MRRQNNRKLISNRTLGGVVWRLNLFVLIDATLAHSLERMIFRRQHKGRGTFAKCTEVRRACFPHSNPLLQSHTELEPMPLNQRARILHPVKRS